MCQLECRVPKQRISVERDEVTRILTVRKFENLADHPLVMGPMYEPHDFKCSSAVRLGVDTAGVLGNLPFIILYSSIICYGK